MAINPLVQALQQQPSAEMQLHEEVPSSIVHVSSFELTLLDKIQGHEHINPKYGIPDYTALAPLVNNPDFQGIFVKIAQDYKQNKVAPPVAEAYIMAKDFMGQHNHPDPNALERDIAHDGHGGDKKLAVFPDNLCNFFDEIRGEPNINEDGLRQYFFGAIALGLSALGAGMGIFGKHREEQDAEHQRRQMNQQSAEDDAAVQRYYQQINRYK